MEGGAVVPLVARGRTIGALGLFNGPERGAHTPAEVDAAVEVGRRAGLALHSARLFAQQRDLADALQHSMLTAPPEVPGCRIVVRYVPAAAGAEIGGDWYDAFLQEDGTTVLAIGDVVGHDRHAAAAMGQVRGLLRGISHSSGAPPAEVLGRLDRAMAGLAPDVMATALVARLERPAELPPGAVLFRWSGAGHPPPLVDLPGRRRAAAGAVRGAAARRRRRHGALGPLRRPARRQHRPAAHRRPGRAPRPRPRRRHRGARRGAAGGRGPAAGPSSATGCSSGCSSPTRRTTSRSWRCASSEAAAMLRDQVT